jgi:oxaloacetate decarboxylase beta subunit
MDILYTNLLAFDRYDLIMVAIGCVLVYLAIAKEMEPTLLLPMGFGTILVNIPFSDALTGPIQELYHAGIANELFPLLLFIGIGAMIDFGPLLSNPKLMLFGAAAQFGIFFTLCMAGMFFPEIEDAASIAIIGAADGPTSIAVANKLGSQYVGPITVAAYSYMALVPIIQPFAIKLVTTQKDRAMKMPYVGGKVSRRTRILFPILVSVIAGLVAPSSVALVGFLMFGNLIRECGILTTLSNTAQNELANLITLLLGITISFSMRAEDFVRPETMLIMGLGLVAFVLDSVVGVLFVKLLNIITPKNKINPMVGAAGISAFPMSSRVIEKLGQEADPSNHLLMHAIAANVSGQIASVVAGGVVLQYFANLV